MMANRKDRRAAQKATPAYLRKSPEAIKRRLIQNGITAKDLEEEYQRGYDNGAEAYIKASYAAVCLALADLHGFGHKRCKAVLNAMDQHILYTLTSAEIIEEVWQRMGLRLVFKEAFDRVVDSDA